MLIGLCGPLSGFLIIKCMWGITEAQYNREFDLGGETNGLKVIYPWVALFGSLCFIAFFGKSGQQMGYAYI